MMKTNNKTVVFSVSWINLWKQEMEWKYWHFYYQKVKTENKTAAEHPLEIVKIGGAWGVLKLKNVIFF